MNALENWRDKLNQVAIVDHRETVELLRWRSISFGSLALRVIKRDLGVFHLEIVGNDWSRFQMNLIPRDWC